MENKIRAADIVDYMLQFTVPVMCGAVGWLFAAIVEVKGDVSVIKAQQLEHDLTGNLVAEMRDTLIRLETSQQYVEKEIRLLRASSKNNP